MVHNLQVHIDEYMDIFCPQFDADAPSTLKFIIYNVTKQSFDQCIVAPGELVEVVSAVFMNVTLVLNKIFHRK